MFRMFLVAYLAVPFVAAATFTGSPIERVNSMACACGQCEVDCNCCAGGGCSCSECECEACGCNGAASLVSLPPAEIADVVLAEGQPTASCCATGVCPSTLASTSDAAISDVAGPTACCAEKVLDTTSDTTLVATQAKCGCEACPADCEGCENCTDGKCVCTDCSDE